MNRKFTAGVVAGALLVVSITALAAPSVGQNEKIQAAQAKMVEARKDMINTQAKVGLITQEQAQRMIEQIDARAAKAQPLTEEQQKELAAAFAKQDEARIDMINAQIEAGVISKEQGDQMIKQIEANAAYREKMGYGNLANGFSPGGRGRRGMGKGGMMRGGTMGSMHGGMMGGMMGQRFGTGAQNWR